MSRVKINGEWIKIAQLTLDFSRVGFGRSSPAESHIDSSKFVSENYPEGVKKLSTGPEDGTDVAHLHDLFVDGDGHLFAAIGTKCSDEELQGLNAAMAPNYPALKREQSKRWVKQ